MIAAMLDVCIMPDYKFKHARTDSTINARKWHAKLLEFVWHNPDQRLWCASLNTSPFEETRKNISLKLVLPPWHLLCLLQSRLPNAGRQVKAWLTTAPLSALQKQKQTRTGALASSHPLSLSLLCIMSTVQRQPDLTSGYLVVVFVVTKAAKQFTAL